MSRKRFVVVGAALAAASLALAGCATNSSNGSSTSAAVTSAAASPTAESSAAQSSADAGASSATGSSDTAAGSSDTAAGSSDTAAGSSDTASSAAGSSDTAASGGSESSGAAGSGAALPKKDVYTIGYSQSNNAEPYRAQLNIQLEYYVKQHPNMKLLPIADAAQDSSKQVSQVQQFIQQKVDVLIVSPNEADPLTPPVEQACKAGIKVIILDRSVNTDCIAAFIGGDNVAIGKAAGELAVKLLPDGGSVVELRGILSNQPQIDRDKGFRDAIAANPKIQIVKDQEAKWLKEDATKVMQQWLQGGTKIDLVYAHNDPMALGAYLAAAGAGKQKDIKFIGIDGLAIPDGGIKAVENGQLAGTFIYPTGAKEAVETIDKMIKGEAYSAKQVLPTTPVTKENAAQIYAENDFSKK